MLLVDFYIFENEIQYKQQHIQVLNKLLIAITPYIPS